MYEKKGIKKTHMKIQANKTTYFPGKHKHLKKRYSARTNKPWLKR